MLMSCHRNLILVYINWPMAELVLLYTVLLKVTETINNIKWGLTVSAIFSSGKGQDWVSGP